MCSNEEATARLLKEKEPTGRFTRPRDIGDMSVFLCTEAGANMTGATLQMDGAWSAR